MTTVPADGESGPAVRVRQAERADLLAVFHIEQEAFPQPWPFSAFERFLGEPAFLVAQVGDGDAARSTATVGDDGRVVGYVVADQIPNHGEPIGHVKDIAVAAEHRSEGVGTKLLQQALTRLAQAGVASVKLEVREGNDGAQSLYRRFGFDPQGRVPRYYANGEDAIVMIREF